MNKSAGANIIQWNCRGYKPNYEELKILIQDLKPSVIALQETKLPLYQSPCCKGYEPLYKNHIGTEKACGGVALLIKAGIPHSNVILNTPLQAICAKVTLNKQTIAVC